MPFRCFRPLSFLRPVIANTIKVWISGVQSGQTDEPPHPEGFKPREPKTKTFVFPQWVTRFPHINPTGRVLLNLGPMRRRRVEKAQRDPCHSAVSRHFR